MIGRFESVLLALVVHAALIVGALVLLAALVAIGWGCIEYSLRRARLVLDFARWLVERRAGNTYEPQAVHLRGRATHPTDRSESDERV